MLTGQVKWIQENQLVATDFLNETSSAIIWNPKQKSIEATSTAEAEAAALSAATQKMIFPRELGAELGMSTNHYQVLSSLTIDCIAMTKNAVNSQNLKNFAIKLHFLQERIDEKVSEVNFCTTKIMTADVLTKAVGRVKFQKFSEEIACDISTQR